MYKTLVSNEKKCAYRDCVEKVLSGILCSNHTPTSSISSSISPTISSSILPTTTFSSSIQKNMLQQLIDGLEEDTPSAPTKSDDLLIGWIEPEDQPRTTLKDGTVILLPCNGKCKNYGCDNYPNYGVDNEVLTCFKHSKTWYKKLLPNKGPPVKNLIHICMKEGCDVHVDRHRKYCTVHKREYEAERQEKRLNSTCITEGCDVRMNKWKKYCDIHRPKSNRKAV